MITEKQITIIKIKIKIDIQIKLNLILKAEILKKIKIKYITIESLRIEFDIISE
jgi:hypothetical protein